LWMFHTNAHRKGLGFEGDILLMKQIINIPCRMSSSKDYLINVHRITILKYKGLDCIIFYNKIGDFGVKVHFATMIDDGFTNILNHFGQFVSANVRMGIY